MKEIVLKRFQPIDSPIFFDGWMADLGEDKKISGLTGKETIFIYADLNKDISTDDVKKIPARIIISNVPESRRIMTLNFLILKVVTL